MGHQAVPVYYATNFALIFIIMAIFYFFSYINICLYYLLKVLTYGLITISCWTSSRHYCYLNNSNRIIMYILPTVWIFSHAVTHTMTCHTTEVGIIY